MMLWNQQGCWTTQQVMHATISYYMYKSFMVLHSMDVIVNCIQSAIDIVASIFIICYIMLQCAEFCDETHTSDIFNMCIVQKHIACTAQQQETSSCSYFGTPPPCQRVLMGTHLAQWQPNNRT
jgi:hypothetical protein